MKISPIICNVPFLKGNVKPQEVKKLEDLKLEELNQGAPDRYEKERKEKQENWQKLINKPQKFGRGIEDGK